MEQKVKLFWKKILKVLEIAVRIYAVSADAINDLLVAILCVWSAARLISEPDSSVMLIVFAHICFVYPIMRIAFMILSIIPVAICKILVSYIDNRNYGWNGWHDTWRQAWGNRRRARGQKSQQNNKQRESSENQGGSFTHTSEPLQEALQYYGMAMPYTAKQVRDRRRELMKKAHPDSGGSEEDAKRINAYYDLLIKYAS